MGNGSEEPCAGICRAPVGERVIVGGWLVWLRIHTVDVDVLGYFVDPSIEYS